MSDAAISHRQLIDMVQKYANTISHWSKRLQIEYTTRFLLACSHLNKFNIRKLD